MASSSAVQNAKNLKERKKENNGGALDMYMYTNWKKNEIINDDYSLNNDYIIILSEQFFVSAFVITANAAFVTTTTINPTPNITKVPAPGEEQER